MAEPVRRENRHAHLGGLALFTNVLELIGNIPPAETEAAYYQQQAITAKAT